MRRRDLYSSSGDAEFDCQRERIKAETLVRVKRTKNRNRDAARRERIMTQKTPISQKQAHFATTITKKVQLNYLLHTPPEEGKHPLIVFLHGHGESGSDLEKVKVHGIPK